jgi:hypothetical protein
VYCESPVQCEWGTVHTSSYQFTSGTSEHQAMVVRTSLSSTAEVTGWQLVKEK